MLPQELDSNVHQLHSVQGGTALLRGSRRVGGNAGEFILCLDTGIAGTGGHLVFCSRMPGEGRVAFLKYAVPGHEGLGGSSLFAGTAIEDHLSASLSLFLQIVLDGKGSRHGSGSQKIVAAAMAVAVGYQFFTTLLPGHLGKSCEGVVLGQDPDHRLSGAIGRTERRLNSAEGMLHLKALLL